VFVWFVVEGVVDELVMVYSRNSWAANKPGLNVTFGETFGFKKRRLQQLGGKKKIYLLEGFKSQPLRAKGGVLILAPAYS